MGARYMSNPPPRRHFSDLSEDEVAAIWRAATDGAIDAAQAMEMNGLSHNGVHNVYRAIQEAVLNEWRASKKWRAHREHDQ